MIVYHVTYKRYLDKILIEGLRPDDEFLYFTDAKGVDSVIKHWVRKDGCVLKVKIPKEWLGRKRKIIMGPVGITTEYRTMRKIDPVYIVDVYCF
jgi:putative transposon-encoded protein